MPPGSLAYESAAIQASWTALMAYWNRLETGLGDHVDFSIYDAVVQVLDPPFGAIGTAAAARGDGQTSYDRDAFQPYPIFRCADGHVRIVVLAPRQWRALWSWLGEPEQLAAPEFASAHHRYAHPEIINTAVAELFAPSTAIELVLEGQRRGVPIAPVLTPGEALTSEHFLARGALIDAESRPGSPVASHPGSSRSGASASGSVTELPSSVNTKRCWTRSQPLPERSRPTRAEVRQPRHPLDGLRVLDLGVIVMGAEAGRLFADQGAEVIKVENRAYPDGSRAVLLKSMTGRFAAGQRGKLGFGVDLRTDEGRAVFKRLVEKADVVLSNFKPGTLESLGLGADVLREVNPRVVVAE